MQTYAAYGNGNDALAHSLAQFARIVTGHHLFPCLLKRTSTQLILTVTRFPRFSPNPTFSKNIIHRFQRSTLHAPKSTTKMSARQSGKVRSANDEGAFAYIVPDEGMESLLAAYADIETEGCTTLTVNQALSYVAVDTPAGWVARKIQVQPVTSSS